MNTPLALFENSLLFLKENYLNYQFYVERDIVWTIQTRLNSQIQKFNLPYRVINDLGMLAGARRSLSTDIGILGRNNSSVEMAVEFKYEPSHHITDIPKNKFPVINWSDVEKDIERINKFVTEGNAKIAISILIDEGGLFRN